MEMNKKHSDEFLSKGSHIDKMHNKSLHSSTISLSGILDGFSKSSKGELKDLNKSMRSNHLHLSHFGSSDITQISRPSEHKEE